MSDQILALDRVGTLESGSFTFTERVGFLKKYGTHSQSFSTLQPSMQYFDVPGMGYIAYMRKWGGTFVLSDPVCAPEDFGNLLESFHQRSPSPSSISCTCDLAFTAPSLAANPVSIWAAGLSAERKNRSCEPL